MAENSIAKANIGVGVDGKKAQAGLQTLKGDLTKWADGTVKQLRGQFQEGFTSGLLGGVVGANFSGIANEIGKSIGNWLNKQRDLNEQLKKTNAEMAKAREAALALKLGRDSESSLGFRDPAKLVEAFRDQIDALRKEKTRLGTELFNTPDSDKANQARLFRGIASIAEDIRIAEAKIRDTLKPFGGDARVAGLVPEINKATESLEKQIITWGLTGDAATRALFVAGGATDDMLARFDAASERLAAFAQFGRGNPLGSAFAGPLSTLLGRGASQLLPQDAPLWLGFALNVADKVGDLAGKAKELKLDQFDNPALRRGSSAEVSARARYELGQSQRDALAEARKANANLRAIHDTAKQIPGQIAAALALSPL